MIVVTASAYEVSIGMAFAVGWNFYPVLRDAVAWSTLTLGIRQPWLSWCLLLRLVESEDSDIERIRLCARSVDSSSGNTSRQLRQSVGSPYFLARKPPDGGSVPFVSKPYVDPFE